MNSNYTLKEIYSIIENSTLSDIIIYMLLIYVFGGLIRFFIGAEFELSDKIKTSPKVALALVLVYMLGIINKLTANLYNSEDKIVQLTIGLSMLVLVAFLYNYVVHVKIVPSYSGKRMTGYDYLDLYAENEGDSEDLASFKRKVVPLEIMDRYSALFNYMIINIIVSLVLCIHFYFDQIYLLAPIIIVCFFFVARGHTSFIKRNGKPIEKVLEKYTQQRDGHKEL